MLHALLQNDEGRCLRISPCREKRVGHDRHEEEGISTTTGIFDEPCLRSMRQFHDIGVGQWRAWRHRVSALCHLR